MDGKILNPLSEEKAQTSLEMLLLLAAAVFMASLVGIYLKNLPQNLVSNTVPTETNQVINQLGDL